MSLLKYNTIRKEWINKNTIELDLGNDSRKHKVEAIYNSAIYTKKSKLIHLLELYYLIFWKGYLKEKNT